MAPTRLNAAGGAAGFAAGAWAATLYCLHCPEVSALFVLTWYTLGVELAAAIGARYHDETLDEAYSSRAAYGAPQWQVDAWVSTYTAVAAGDLATVDPALERLIGRSATPLAEVLRRP